MVIPPEIQYQVKAELHRDHPGIVRMKMLAQPHVWWPGLNQELEDLVNGCLSCQSHKHTPSVAHLYPWVFSRHVDGIIFMLILLAHF